MSFCGVEHKCRDLCLGSREWPIRDHLCHQCCNYSSGAANVVVFLNAARYMKYAHAAVTQATVCIGCCTICEYLLVPCGDNTVVSNIWSLIEITSKVFSVAHDMLIRKDSCVHFYKFRISRSENTMPAICNRKNKIVCWNASTCTLSNIHWCLISVKHSLA